MVLGITDMQGRLQGKRLSARFFLNEVSHHGTEGCNYLLAVDVDMTPLPGYRAFNWEQGYGDFSAVPDLGTIRLVPWLEKTALDPAESAPRMKALRMVGVAYTDAEIAKAAADVKGKTEMDALVAYLQGLGLALK